MMNIRPSYSRNNGPNSSPTDALLKRQHALRGSIVGLTLDHVRERVIEFRITGLGTVALENVISQHGAIGQQRPSFFRGLIVINLGGALGPAIRRHVVKIRRIGLDAEAKTLPPGRVMDGESP